MRWFLAGSLAFCMTTASASARAQAPAGGDYNQGGAPPNRIMARIILPRLLEARESLSTIRSATAREERRRRRGGASLHEPRPAAWALECVARRRPATRQRA